MVDKNCFFRGSQKCYWDSRNTYIREDVRDLLKNRAPAAEIVHFEPEPKSASVAFFQKCLKRERGGHFWAKVLPTYTGTTLFGRIGPRSDLGWGSAKILLGIEK